MRLTRRGFVKSAGFGTAAGLLGGSTLISSSVLAQARSDHHAGLFDLGEIHLNQNESGRGPGPKTLEAIRKYTNYRVGRGYAPDFVPELQNSIAARFDVPRNYVLLASGSTWLLQASTRAWCSADRPLVTAGPTFATSEATARQIGATVKQIPLDQEAKLDLDAMVAQSKGAGLVYFCNPNNPTGTVHSPQAIEKAVRAVLAASPETHVHLDEAYIDYADPAKMQTGHPLTREFENVFVTRSFSKAHALAGMRIGYALAQPQTLSEIRNAWGMGDVAMLSAVAALTAFEDVEHLEWEREENTRVRDFVVGALADLGYDTPESHTNHIFPNFRQPASNLRSLCQQHKVLVGRDFPPLHNTHCRISLGSMEEMQVAVDVFRKVLS
ncbi:MAG: aminotransferase class I/II-fold pyridoxal phosphate-dependent enzyme [Gammaproteobacteria bacterium]|nr:aminotransferase class I/II-fold pyridoxal phosphate-dependent enzyme [Gammaproteobacteria bacterium]MCY4358882.1 aminotransferase class I/II-fold pyridoxal phosphate-dependent enzyme [Gammaproteobacteria bacterium]